MFDDRRTETIKAHGHSLLNKLGVAAAPRQCSWHLSVVSCIWTEGTMTAKDRHVTPVGIKASSN
jgi:hypothetical protein